MNKFHCAVVFLVVLSPAGIGWAQCPNNFLSPAGLPQDAFPLHEANIDLVYNATTGNLTLNGHAIDPSVCWAPYFVNTQQTVTVTILAKFMTDASVVATTTSIVESGIEVRGVPAVTAAPGGPAAGIEKAICTDFNPDPNTPAGQTQITTYLAPLSRLIPQAKKIYCALDPVNCRETALHALQTQTETLADSEKAALPAAGATYLNQLQFNTFYNGATSVASQILAIKKVIDAYPAGFDFGLDLEFAAEQWDCMLGEATRAWTGLKEKQPNWAESPDQNLRGFGLLLKDILAGGVFPETGPEALKDDLDNLRSASSIAFQEIDTLHDRSEQRTVTVLLHNSGNAVYSLSFIVHDNYKPFIYSPLKAIPATTPSTSGNGSQQQTRTQSGSAPEQHVVRTVQIQVHHLYRFNAVGGFYWSSARQRAFALKTGSPAGTTTAPMLVTAYQNQNTYQNGGMAGLEIYFKKRDVFPGYFRRATDRLTPGLLVGAEMSSPTGFLIGPVFEPVTGIDFYGGINIAQMTNLANGVVLGSTLFGTSATVPVTQNWTCCKVFFGVGLDAHIFSSIFTGIFGGGGPGAAGGSGQGTGGGGGKSGH